MEHFDGIKHKFMKGEKGLSAKKDFDKLMNSCRVCKKQFEKEGGKIYNASVGGKLEVFERKSLDEVILKK